jgi:hypothetical protein
VRGASGANVPESIDLKQADFQPLGGCPSDEPSHFERLALLLAARGPALRKSGLPMRFGAANAGTNLAAHQPFQGKIIVVGCFRADMPAVILLTSSTKLCFTALRMR